MSQAFCIIGVICGIFVLSAASVLFVKHDEDDIIITSIVVFLADVIMLFLIILSVVRQETIIIDKNIDHDKTKIIEVNGEEYHFTFEKEKK